jgi:hypothetical protein
MFKQKPEKKFFWIVLLAVFLLSGGYITASSANTTSSDLIINEFMAANGSGLTDEDGDYSDWIEIYNQSDSAVNLGGWALTDDVDQPQKWPFPDMSLGSHEYLVVFASGKNRTSVEAGTPLHTNFKLSKSGEYLALHNILERRFMDIISPQYAEQFRDVSYGRFGENLAFGYLPTPSPGRPNDETFAQAGAVSPVTFSVERGFYENPFTVELTTDTPQATIRYTTDGSEPTPSSGTIYTEPIPVQATTLLRAAAFKPGFVPSVVNTQSYLFLNDVLTQFPMWTSALSDLPSATRVIQTATAFDLGSQTIDKSVVREGLTSIATVSLVTDNQSQALLYAQPETTAKTSERPVSIELIYPDHNKTGTQVNAGIRPYGEVATSTPKQSFRLYFRGKYGSTSFDYRLFPDSAVETFDTLILQASGDNNQAGDAAYIRNEWLRASQIEMSGLGSHGMFVNLYLNGRFLGLYNLMERPNGDFMSSYLGGEKEDWIVANQAGVLNDDAGYQTDELNYLFTTLALANSANSELVQPDYLADTYAAAAAYLDPNQLADYILLSWYAETLGWPESSWYAAIRSQDLPGRGKLLIGEELQLPSTQGSQIGLGQVTEPLGNVHLAHLEKLMEDPDFKVQFADRLYKHLLNDGVLTDANAQARWQDLNKVVDQAAAAASARWKTTDDRTSMLQNDGLTPADEMPTQMMGTASRLVARAREAGYYPDFDPPIFNQNGGVVEAGYALEMTLSADTCSDCIIYYTTDGSDPRLPITGEVIPIARAYNSPVPLDTNAHVQARVWRNGSWSALQEATFSVVEQDNKLRITEIMYNPLGGDDYEFIELQNVGNSELRLAGVSLEEGVRFTFLPTTPPLAPGKFVVLVSNPETFAERYPDVPISGVYEGHLSNKGEKIILRDGDGEMFIEVEYGDHSGWPISADGRGDSLTLVDQDGYPSEPTNWRASTNLYGSPGAVD